MSTRGNYYTYLHAKWSMWYNGWLYSIILARWWGPPAVPAYLGGQQKMLNGDEREDTYRKANTTFFLTIPTTA